MGVNGLSTGTESGDGETLKSANKGYTFKDVLEQCKNRMRIAGGKDRTERNFGVLNTS